MDEGVVAVSDAEAQSRVGKVVSIGPQRVTFPGYGTCIVRQVNALPGAYFRNYPRGLSYDCTAQVYLPNFFVGARCDRILASLDGANYLLVHHR